MPYRAGVPMLNWSKTQSINTAAFLDLPLIHLPKGNTAIGMPRSKAAKT
jgi:hypothetical protein